MTKTLFYFRDSQVIATQNGQTGDYRLTCNGEAAEIPSHFYSWIVDNDAFWPIEKDKLEKFQELLAGFLKELDGCDPFLWFWFGFITPGTHRSNVLPVLQLLTYIAKGMKK